MWKDIDEYNGYYEVNDCGDVRSHDRYIMKSNGVMQLRKSIIVSKQIDRNGYNVVKLNKNGVTKVKRVARLVALAFVPGYFDGAEVNHKDCNRTNDCASNLEWVTHYDNIAYTKSLKRHVSDRDLTGESNPNYGKHTLKLKYKEHPELRNKQSRPGAINGRSRKVEVNINGDILQFDCLSQCAQYLIDHHYTLSSSHGNVATYIRKAAEQSKKYLGLEFRFI